MRPLCFLPLTLLPSTALAHAHFFPEEMPVVANPDYGTPMHELVPAPSPLSPGGYCALCVEKTGPSAVERYDQRRQQAYSPNEWQQFAPPAYHWERLVQCRPSPGIPSMTIRPHSRNGTIGKWRMI
ncbi:MAG: hypothetical protein OXB94_09785 [Nitrospira sp.]|nr:hypothetical protein [Nitrospira sp.]